jgi:hypothetical protein
MEMRTGDVDSNDWMEAFDEWQREVLRGLLVTFGVTPPEAYVTAVNSGAAAGGYMLDAAVTSSRGALVAHQLGNRCRQHMHRCYSHSMH